MFLAYFTYPQTFALNIADKGINQALLDDPQLRNGLNVHSDKVTYKEVAEDLGYEYTPAKEMLV